MSQLRRKLAAGETVCAVTISSGSAAAVEIAGGLEFAAVVIDARHAAISPYSGEVENLVRAADVSRTPALVSLPDITPGTVNRALNDGADGIIAPDVRSAAEARAAVSAARYPPAGRRGAAPVVRAARFGMTDWEEYRADTNEQRLVLAALESPESMHAAPEILSVEGLDGILLDALTTGLAAGRDQELSPGEGADVLRVAQTCGKIAGVLARAPVAESWARAGWRLVVLGSDLEAYAQKARALRRTLEDVPRSISSADRAA